MKIAVCVKQVPTREWQPRLDEARTWIREADASFEMNEPDAYALEESFRLKEKHGGEVVVCSAGPARVAQVLREALARGADRAIHVQSDQLASADALAVAGALADAMRGESFDLVLTGLQSDDQGFAQTGVILAEKLGLPHATIVMEIDASGSSNLAEQEPDTGKRTPAEPGRGEEAPGEPNRGEGTHGESNRGKGAPGLIKVKRELEGGWFQWVALPAPAVLTIQSGINQLRYATLKGIMAAKKKEIRVVAPAAAPSPQTTIVALYAPAKGKKTQMIGGSPADAAKELVKKLRDDARVI